MQEVPADPAAIILRARKIVGETQREFAARLGSAQSLVCKYERGEVSPPADLLIQCMNLIRVGIPDISEEDLATLVRTRLRGARMAPARLAVANLIQCIPESRPQSTRRRPPTSE
ncbi:helix-turn-helix domain-containing protein [Variovorax paradoxus]|uniref:helix-turn-helix domain-containing protein n=2 Tax=Comamonadaceae TaxID=80864 RepID=UPI0010F9132C